MTYLGQWFKKNQDATQVKRGNQQTGRKNSLAAIKRYIRDNHYAGQPSKLSWLISYLKRIEGVKIGKYEASLKARELEKLYKLEEIEHLLPHLEKVLQSKRVVVLVDELDRGWDASEDAQAFVAGLFQACLSINQLSPNLTVYMSLRQELYDNIPALYDDAQKYRDLIEYVRWDEVGLRRLVCKRLRYNFHAKYPQNHWAPDQPSDGYLWNQFMCESFPGDLPSFSYLANRTLFRPREIIQFCSQIVDYARENSHTLPLTHNAVSLAEPAYSDERAKDIAAEFRLQYPRLLQVFEGFRGVNVTLSRNDVEEICLRIICEDWPAGDYPEWIENLDPSNLVEILWRIGFLCAHTAATATGGLGTNGNYVGSHQFASLNLRKSDSFQVHPMFQTWLGIGEAST